MITNTTYDDGSAYLYTETYMIGGCYWNLDIPNSPIIVPVRYIKVGERDISFRLVLSY